MTGLLQVPALVHAPLAHRFDSVCVIIRPLTLAVIGAVDFHVSLPSATHSLVQVFLIQIMAHDLPLETIEQDVSFVLTVHGKWSEWGSWSECPSTCGLGIYKVRSRDCDDPAPQHDGNDCPGPETDRSICNFVPCPG